MRCSFILKSAMDAVISEPREFVGACMEACEVRRSLRSPHAWSCPSSLSERICIGRRKLWKRLRPSGRLTAERLMIRWRKVEDRRENSIESRDARGEARHPRAASPPTTINSTLPSPCLLYANTGLLLTSCLDRSLTHMSASQEEFKAAGNKAFAAKDYDSAIEQFTKVRLALHSCRLLIHRKWKERL